MTVIDYILIILIVLFIFFHQCIFDIFFNMFMHMHLKKRYNNNKRLFNIFIKEIKVHGIYDDYIKYCKFKNINHFLTCNEDFKIKSFMWFAKDYFFIDKTPIFFLNRLTNICMYLNIFYGKDC